MNWKNSPFLLLLVLGTWIDAGEKADFETEVTEATIVVRSQLKAESYSLTVRGEDILFEQEWDGKKDVILLPVNEHGLTLEDGLYVYEIKANVKAKKENPNGRDKHGKRDAKQFKGSFRIVDGNFLIPSGEEEESPYAKAAPEDIHDGEVVIKGSACIGLGCVDNESFGYDTLRLKATNIRLRFEDTTGSSSSRPGTDWRLMINDTESGGMGYFAIRDDDTDNNIFALEAGAPDNSLYVDDLGQIGLGTVTPEASMDIQNAGAAVVVENTNAPASSAHQILDLQSQSPLQLEMSITDPNNLSSWIMKTGYSDFVIKENAANNQASVLQLNEGGGMLLRGSSVSDSPTNILFDLDSSGNLTLSGTITAPFFNISAYQASSLQLGGTWNLRDDSGDFTLREISTGNDPIRVNAGAPSDSLNIASDGTVSAPSMKVQSDEAALIVEDTSPASTNLNQIMELSSRGPLQMQMSISDPVNTRAWAFKAVYSDLTIKENTANGKASNFHILEGGGIQVRGSNSSDFPSDLFEVDSNGNATLQGTLTQNSNVQVKENHGLVDPMSMLAKVNELPIARWTYLDDDCGADHVGPMAQDFFETFALGMDDKSIATIDTSGVALAAIQALSQLVEDKDARIAELEAKLIRNKQSVEARLAALEAQLNK